MSLLRRPRWAEDLTLDLEPGCILHNAVDSFNRKLVCYFFTSEAFQNRFEGCWRDVQAYALPERDLNL